MKAMTHYFYHKQNSNVLKFTIYEITRIHIFLQYTDVHYLLDLNFLSLLLVDDAGDNEGSLRKDSDS
jgi:hypothetical protein